MNKEVSNKKTFDIFLRERMRTGGYFQSDLAKALGLHPKVLSRKLHSRGGVAQLTPSEFDLIIATLIEWNVITTTSEIQKLADLAQAKQDQSFWSVLSLLNEDKLLSNFYSRDSGIDTLTEYVNSRVRATLEPLLSLPPKQRKVTIDALRELIKHSPDLQLTNPRVREDHYEAIGAVYPTIATLLESLSLQQPIARTVRIRIDEDPLTMQNLNAAISALTELSTKYWLIAQGRYADLIEYTQTHNSRLVEEANIVITKISYNSPLNIDLKFGATDVADAVVKTVDGFTQRKERLEKAQLENRAKAQQIKEAEHKAEQDKQKAELEREKQQVEIEKQRLELLSTQLDMQKKSFEMALELAGKAVDALQPNIDPSTRAMAIQAILPNIIQLDNVRGLTITLLPPTPPAEESTE